MISPLALPLVLLAAPAFTAALAIEPRQASTFAYTCTNQTLSVPTQVGGSVYQIAYTICQTKTRSSASSVGQLLIHGFSYDKEYWTRPEFNRIYSYADFATSTKGHTVVAFDAPAAGQNVIPADWTKPSLSAQAAVSLLFGGLMKAGALPGQSWPVSKVTALGHSFGAQTLNLAISFPGSDLIFDGIVFSGHGHYWQGVQNPAIVTQDNNPADPWRPLVTPANTYRPDKWGSLNAQYRTISVDIKALLYAPATYDPLVLAIDDATDSVASMQLGNDPLRPRVYAPVDYRGQIAIVNGASDPAIGCSQNTANCDQAAFSAWEQALYPRASSFSATLLQGFGHCLNNLDQSKAIVYPAYLAHVVS